MLEGYAKLSRGADGSSRFYHAMGVPFADLLGLATIIVEIVGGLLILAGAFAPVAAVAMIVVLLVAIFTVHLPNGCSSIKLTSYDAAARTSARPLCVAGAPSVDGYLKARREARLAEGPCHPGWYHEPNTDQTYCRLGGATGFNPIGQKARHYVTAAPHALVKCGILEDITE